MTKTRQYYSAITHARPPIFFRIPVLGMSKKIRKAWVSVYGDEPPEKSRLKEFTAAYMRLGTREHREFERAATSEDRDLLAALPLLRRASSSRAAAGEALFQAALRLIPDYPVRNYEDVPSRFTQAARKTAARMYAGLLNPRIEGARLEIHHGQPCIVCGDIVSAAFTYASFYGLGACEACGRAFAPDPERPEQKFCSTKCSNRAHQRKFRKKHPGYNAKYRRKRRK